MGRQSFEEGKKAVLKSKIVLVTLFPIVFMALAIVAEVFLFVKDKLDFEDKLMLLKGFFLNLFNPTVWLLWLANVTAISKTLDYSMIKMIAFFSIILGAVLAVELFKVKLAGKIKHYLTPKIMTTVNYITGSALIIFGLILIYNHYFNK